MDPARGIPEIVGSAAGAAGIGLDPEVFELVARVPSEEADLAPDGLISENIQLVALLGAGGMGNVWLADHLGLETQVAVKFMSSEIAADDDCAKRFGIEAKLAARIKSPHVVSILDYATTARGVPYIVMELLEGGDLEMRLRGDRRLGLEDSSRVVVQICKALSKAHALGIVHRDIKPDNIFLVEHEGEIFVKVLDFGIAKDEQRERSITASGTTMGTPSFMSPEQLFRPKEVDLRSDLWSTAVVAYRCLTGKLPFEGDNFAAMCISVHDGKFPPPSSLDSSLPRDLDAWFAKALSLDPRDRFQSAADMANAYLAVLDKARLLPTWAIARNSSGDRASYASDPGGISGGPIVVRRSRRVDARALLLGFLVAAISILAATPERDALLGFVAGFIDSPFEELPALNPTPNEPPPHFRDPFPYYPPPPSPPALAPREPEMQPLLRRTPQRNLYDSPNDPLPPFNTQFGI
jgi:serine/threonine protein kinase